MPISRWYSRKCLYSSSSSFGKIRRNLSPVVSSFSCLPGGHLLRRDHFVRKKFVVDKKSLILTLCLWSLFIVGDFGWSSRVMMSWWRCPSWWCLSIKTRADDTSYGFNAMSSFGLHACIFQKRHYNTRQNEFKTSFCQETRFFQIIHSFKIYCFKSLSRERQSWLMYSGVVLWYTLVYFGFFGILLWASFQSSLKLRQLWTTFAATRINWTFTQMTLTFCKSFQGFQSVLVESLFDPLSFYGCMTGNIHGNPDTLTTEGERIPSTIPVSKGRFRKED